MKLTHLQLLNSLRLFLFVCQVATCHIMSYDNHPLFDDLEYIAGAYLRSPVPMFLATYVRRTYVARYRCPPVPIFPRPMFIGTYVPQFPHTYVISYLCSPEPMFPGTYVPPYLCSTVPTCLCYLLPMFPGTYVPRYLCSRT